ncbi:MAG: response regulator [Proteobacteria bacterium]|nr:response regulator [Pseudomonadota bacterium]
MNVHSIRNKLALLILLTVAPCLAILVYTGIEQRRHLIGMARSDVLLLTRSIAEAQKAITRSTQQILSTLSQTPTMQVMEPNACSAVLGEVLEKNPDYSNLVLVDLKGDVIASGKPFVATNLADRKHIKEALEKNDFAAGEYIVTRVGTANPAFAFAYPVSDKEGMPKAVLATTIKLDVFSNFYDDSQLPERSFVAITDSKGVRLFYYPAQEKTNPLGKPIQETTWNIASKGGEEGLFFSTGSDGLRRVLAYVKIHLPHEDSPYLYVWAGVPESHVLAPANTAMIRNVLLLFLVSVISLFISWVIGRKTLIRPIQQLVVLAQKFGKGEFEARSEQPAHAGELGMLTTAFHDMAASLALSRKELEESDQRFKTVADFAHDWEYWVDQDGTFIYSSPSCKRITGYASEEIVSDPELVFKMVKPEYAEMVRRHFFNESKENTADLLLEYPIVTKSGEEVWVEHNCTPVYDAEGNYAGRRGSNRDITDRKRVEKEHQILSEQLQQARKIESIGQLAGGVAHDFNNMLSVILGYGNIILEKTPADDPLYEYAREIVAAGKRSASIIRQLLGFARKQTIVPRVLGLNESLEEMLKMLRRLIGEDIDLIWHPSPVWPVFMDPSQLDQILANICVNARDAIGGVGRVTIETEKKTFDEASCSEHSGCIPGDFVVLVISDDGKGMDSDTVSRIFDPFFTTKEMGQGTGLGLATVYGIVKQNNGFINVYSELGRGTTFRIYIPRLSEDVTDPVKQKEEILRRGRGETILLVEDEASVLKLTGRILTSLGYAVVAVSSPEEAVRLASEPGRHFDLLITDVIMPEMNGRDLAGRFLSLHPGLRCLFMSGYTADVIARQGVLEEGVNFIQKPFSKVDLAAKVSEVLLGKREIT